MALTDPAITTEGANANANPDLMRRVISSYRDFSNILETKPGEVRATLGELYPKVDAATMDVLYDAEHSAWRMRPDTAESMKPEIAFVANSGTSLPGTSLPGIEKLDPAGMMYMPPT